jgi:hypothetical protein
MKKAMLLAGLMAVMLVSLAYATSAVKGTPVTEDRSAELGQVSPADFCETLWAWDLEAQTGDNWIVGTEYKWGYHWVSGGNSGAGTPQLYKFDEFGNLVGQYNQGAGSSGWGMRDMAEDEDYIWGSFSANIDAYDEFGSYVTSIPGPENPNRALARDPNTGVWWTGDFYDPIYSFTSPPLVILTTTPDAVYAKYGMAWDICSPDGPWLWIFEQNLYNLRQFDPVALAYTGVMCTVNTGLPSSVAGGACFDEATGDIYGIIQGTPDHLFAVDITEGCGADTAYCKVTNVSVPEEFYLPGDVIELTVHWKYVDTGPWGMENAFVVGGGLGKEPNGQPRLIQNHTTGVLTPGSYQEVFYFTVPMATPLGTGVGGGGHCWPTWSGPNQPEQSVYIEHNLCMIDVYTPPEFLIYDKDPTPNSGPAIAAQLDAMGHTYEFVTSLAGWNLPDHLGLFVLLGIYASNAQIAAGSPDAIAIEDYIYGGGKVYMEGGDTWYYDPQFMGAHDFGPAFGILGLADGTSDLYQVDGLVNSWLDTSGYSAPYLGENSYIDQLAGTGGGEACFQNVAYAYYCGVANGGWGKTVGASFEIGGVGFCGDFVGQFANW